MHLLTLGLNHQSAPLAMRERVAFAGESLVKAAYDLKSRVGDLLRESAILSTCNRTEIYCATPQPQATSQALEQWIASHGGLKAGDIVKQIGEYQVVDMMSYMRALGKFNKGEKAEVTCLRGKEIVKVEVEF